MIVHIVAHAGDQGIPPIMTASVLSTSAGISIIGRLIVGFLSHRRFPLLKDKK